MEMNLGVGLTSSDVCFHFYRTVLVDWFFIVF